MKIGTISSTVATTAIDTDRRTATQQSTTSSVSMPLDDDSSTQVELSPEATMLSHASEDPSFDQAKVERIAQAIRDGSFSINPGAIADKLLSNAQEVLGRSQPQH
ncbi:flagellar biosynthesis anti-sigma factor FlgM [Scleromatobacter humisilvae]|uniref:Negative regulator of flagellin synthesis n=1 Tax=Scleromatobacter humisilvae TaxID=2897159 RepID=A0A9X2C150_9BURK|nr:flagellar biosynthesis anti-sigma factor FlgM [Scleromatobacter humisilvae]MCK9684605.1 flagellar biosynthesis anti-sigma factor FlgM [Scleromatobacter humisilvae]